jgi:hypothetical protein
MSEYNRVAIFQAERYEFVECRSKLPLPVELHSNQILAIPPSRVGNIDKHAEANLRRS